MSILKIKIPLPSLHINSTITYSSFFGKVHGSYEIDEEGRLFENIHNKIHQQKYYTTFNGTIIFYPIEPTLKLEYIADFINGKLIQISYNILTDDN